MVVWATIFALAILIAPLLDPKCNAITVILGKMIKVPKPIEIASLLLLI